MALWIFGCAWIGINWGLPNGNEMWAADSVAPMTPFAVAYHVFAGEGFNSGYFYFKYPIGHQLLLAAWSSPIIAYAALTGDLSSIQTDYPFGFSSPEIYLSWIAVWTRVLSALFATGTVLLVAGIGRRLFGKTAGALAGLGALASYPLFFYSHTSNVETAFLFWAFLCLYATIRGLEAGTSPRWFWVVGIAAALAVSTKEQIAGFLVLLPPTILLVYWAKRNLGRGIHMLVPRGIPTGALLSGLTMLVLGAAFFNPSGFLNRFRFLTHTLDPEVREKYSAYEFPIDFSTDWGFSDELAHIGKAFSAIVTSIGWPLAVLGVLGILWTAIKYRHALIYLAAPLIGYYFVSLRVLKQVEIRYTLPLSTLLVIPAGLVLAHLWRRSALGRILASLVIVSGMFYSAEILPTLTYDNRYLAEQWMAPRLAAGQTVEVYQSWTYLPRWRRQKGVHKPKFDEISVEAVRERDPDYIVLSSKGKEGIMMYPNPDWRDGRGMMLEAKPNRQFLMALESGSLGYELTSLLSRRLRIKRTLITSHNPDIFIYARKTPSSETASGRHAAAPDKAKAAP